MNDWEVGRVATLQEMLDGVHSSTHVPDRVAGSHTKEGVYTVNSVYMRRVLELIPTKVKYH